MSNIHKINEVVKITDPVTVTGGVAVEPGVDPILVHLQQHDISGNLGALDAVLDVNPDCAVGTAVFQISGTWKGKIVVEGAIDGTYNNLSIVQPGGAISFAGINNDSQNGIYRILLIAGYTKLRLRMSAYTSGTANCIFNAAPLVPTTYAWQLNAANLQVTANQSTGTNLHTVVDSVTNPVAITNANLDAKLSDIKTKTDNLDATISSLVSAVNTLLKPANTLTKVNTVDTITNAISVANGSGVKIYDENDSTYKGLRFNAGNPQICAQNYLHALAEGDIPGHVEVFKAGVNNDIDDTQEDVWEIGGTYVWPTSAAGLEVVSSSAEDDIDKGAGVPGTGIHKIIIYYLDNTFTEKSEEVTLNGTGVVATSATDIYRIQYVEASVCGTTGIAAGNIDIRHLSDSPIYARISQGYTKSRQLIYTVPKTKTLYIAQLTCGAICSGTNGARFILRATYSHLASTLRTFFLPHGEISVENGSISMALDIPEHFPAGTDIKVSAIGTSASANITATVGMRGWLE